MRRQSQKLEAACAKLKYGAVVLNAWSADAYGVFSSLWGGYAGPDSVEKIDSVQSGLGFVGNSFMFDYPAKCVVKTPFTDPGHMGAGDKMDRKKVGQLTDFIVNPGLMSFLRMVAPGVFDNDSCFAGICARRSN